MPQAPRSDDTFKAPKGRAAIGGSIFSRRLERFLSVLYAADEDADKRYKDALKELKRDPGEAVIAIARASSCCDNINYPRRWALVYAATQMEHEAALPFFRDLVLAPLPLGQPSPAHRNTAVREETILRTTAIDGVGRLAAGGNKRALEHLHEFLDVPSVSVRRATVQEILKVAPRSRAQLAKRLPAEQQFLLDIKQLPVSDVPQIKDPTAHLRDAKAQPKEPAPPLPDNRSRRRGSPKVRGE